MAQADTERSIGKLFLAKENQSVAVALLETLYKGAIERKDGDAAESLAILRHDVGVIRARAERKAAKGSE